MEYNANFFHKMQYVVVLFFRLIDSFYMVVFILNLSLKFTKIFDKLFFRGTNMNILKGAFTALVTPMNADGSVDFDGFRANVKYQLEQGIDGLVPLGTTAETPTLDDKPGSEEDKLIEIVFDEVRKFEKTSNKKIPVILGAGSNCTKDAVAYCERAKKAGADAALVVTPYYNKCTQAGLYAHYEAIAKEAKAPIIMYSVASRTGCNIAPETAAKLVKNVDGIVGIKEASGNISQIAKIMQLTDGNIDLYSGNDDQIVPLLSAGGIRYPLVTGLLSSIIVVFITRMCYMSSRRRFTYGVLSFIDNDSWSLITTIVYTVVAAILFSLGWPYVINFLKQLFEMIASDIYNPINMFVYGVIERIMSLFGLDVLIILFSVVSVGFSFLVFT